MLIPPNPLSVALRELDKRWIIVHPVMGIPLKNPDGSVRTFSTYGAADDCLDTIGYGLIRPYFTIE